MQPQEMKRPEWRETLIRANAHRERAAELDAQGDFLRCPEREGGGVRCTGDRGHKGACRISEAELSR